MAERPMRIIHVLHSHGYGGAENHALVLMDALRHLGHEVLFAGPHDSWLAARCAERKIGVHPLRMAGLFDVASHVSLRRCVARWAPDIVHGHLVRGAHYAGWSTVAQSRARAVCTAHATTAHKHMGRCGQIIAVSRAVRDNLVAHRHAETKISVVYNGMPDSPGGDRASLRRELGLDDETFALANVGRFIRDKGQDIAVEALRHTPANVQLCLIGDADTPYGRQVSQAASQAGLEPSRVRFLGYRGDVPRLLPAFDAYLSSSRREALGLSLVEAAAAGLPTIATAVGGVPEVVLHQRTGWLVPADNPTAMAEAITLMSQGPEARQSLGASARQHYLDHFTVPRMVQGTLSVYAKALSS